MAFVRDQYCYDCCKETQHINGDCVHCKDKEYRKRTAAWNSMTTKQKLTDIRKRLEKLEQGPATY